METSRTDATRRPAWNTTYLVPFVVAVLEVVATSLVTHHPGGHLPAHVDVTGWVLLFVGPLALLARRRYPVLTLAVTLAATIGPHDSRFAFLSVIVAFVNVIVSGHRRAAWAGAISGYVLALWINPLLWGQSLGDAVQAGLLAAWLAVLYTTGEAFRFRQERSVTAALNRDLESRRRTSELRLQMARDLHDVIGHNISLISVQAGVGLDLMDAQPEQARAALVAIRKVSKDALEELRSMLAELNSADELTDGHSPRAPAGVARVAELIRASNDAGMGIELHTEGDPFPLPTAVDLAVYRIVQESLTNVVRHAPGAATTVKLAYEPDRLHLEVVNGAARRPPSAPSRGTGMGVAGMTARAHAAGGTLTAEAVSPLGFAVVADLPTTPRPADAPDDDKAHA